MRAHDEIRGLAEPPRRLEETDRKEGKEGKLSGLSEAEIKTLDEILPYIKFASEGVDKKPTIQFS